MNSYKLSFLYIFIFLSFSIACDNQSQQLTEAQKNELILAIDTFNTAFADGKLSVLESMITDNYKHTNGTSKVIGKEQWLNYLKKRNQEIETGILTINSYDMDQLNIEFHNAAAIVTARVVAAATKNGEYSKSEYRVTNIWVYEEEAWKRAGFHDGKIQ